MEILNTTSHLQHTIINVASKIEISKNNKLHTIEVNIEYDSRTNKPEVYFNNDIVFKEFTKQEIEKITQRAINSVKEDNEQIQQIPEITNTNNYGKGL
jgi:hypothetical protein